MSSITLRRIVRVALAAAMMALVCLPCAVRAQTSATTRTAAAANDKTASNSDRAPQGRTVGADQGSSTGALPVGRVIFAELTQTIDVRKAKPGEPIFAKVTLGVLSQGKVLIADGATITGHITEAKTRSEKDPQSVLGILFDQVATVDGKELPLDLTVQALSTSELRAPSALKVNDDGPYAAVPGPISGSARPPRGAGGYELPPAETDPPLDLGSQGIVGVTDLKLTEGADAMKGSLVSSTRKNVKLGDRWQLVLRVIVPSVAARKK
jgi:hypothetical protein